MYTLRVHPPLERDDCMAYINKYYKKEWDKHEINMESIDWVYWTQTAWHKRARNIQTLHWYHALRPENKSDHIRAESVIGCYAWPNPGARFSGQWLRPVVNVGRASGALCIGNLGNWHEANTVDNSHFMTWREILYWCSFMHDNNTSQNYDAWLNEVDDQIKWFLDLAFIQQQAILRVSGE